MPITKGIPKASTWAHSVLQLRLLQSQLLLIWCKHGVLFLDTFMKDCHVVNIALPSHAHLSLDIFPWSSLCFR